MAPKKQYPKGPKPADKKGKPVERPTYDSAAGKALRRGR